jgi:anti-sigma B factor antagonist
MERSAGVTTPTGITVSHEDGTILVRLRGEIDATQRDEASHAMVAVLGADGPVTIDTSAVTFIDSSGLAFLLQLHGVLTEASRPVILRDPSGSVLDVLALVGLDTLFTTQRTGLVTELAEPRTDEGTGGPAVEAAVG